MSHNLNFVGGKASIFTTAATWHKEESGIYQPSSSEEVIKIANLDYEVTKVPIQACLADDCKTIPNKWATVRTDNNTPLGVVGSKYHVLQNKDAFTFIDDLVGNNQALFTSAGVLGQGEKIWLSLKLPTSITVGLDDVAEYYFFLTNSHDGLSSVQIGFTETFIVCENTLRMAMSNSKRTGKVRHTINVQGNLINTAHLIGIANQIIQKQQFVYNEMTKVAITDTQLRKFIELALNPQIEQISKDEYSKRFTNTVDNILKYTLEDETQLIDSRKGNLFGALQGVTGYYNNVKSYDKSEDKLSSIMWGVASNKQSNALNLAMNVVEKSITLS